jgi:hypothetical protein
MPNNFRLGLVILALVVITVAAMTPTHGQHASEVSALRGSAPTAAAAGPLEAYAMSNGVDSSGNNRTATLNNTTLVAGQYNAAQQFNGTNAQMVAPAITLTNAFTVEAWANLRVQTVQAGTFAASGWQAIIYQGVPNAVDRFFIAEAGGFITGGFMPVGSTTVQQVTGPSRMSVNAWHHLALVYDGTQLLLYMDGAEVARAAAAGALRPSTEPVEIGGSAKDGGWVDGMIDDVRVYDRALTASEITTDRSTPIDTTVEKVVSWDLEVFAAAANPADAASMPIAIGNFPVEQAMCNLSPLPPTTGNVNNPTHARVDDPMVAGRQCEIVAAKFFDSVPLGTGWKATAKARGATTASVRSPVSNSFDRVAESVPPGTPGKPAVIAK